MALIQLNWQANPRATVAKQGQFTFEGKTYHVERKSNQLVTISNRVNESAVQLNGDRVQMAFMSGGMISMTTKNFNGEGPLSLYACHVSKLANEGVANFLGCDEASAQTLVADITN
ncbi:MAG: hypothetical protein KBE16_02755 [Alphaproteobacteria bacterium]|jgi:hypothetical protein|nr:hypothetical protein [Alphaproteobacteria bacterium]MBP9877718.1 hypothetical protein [Alphaproteobacteria bacterium]